MAEERAQVAAFIAVRLSESMICSHSNAAFNKTVNGLIAEHALLWTGHDVPVVNEALWFYSLLQRHERPYFQYFLPLVLSFHPLAMYLIASH